jgi:hypothetical protein
VTGELERRDAGRLNIGMEKFETGSKRARRRMLSPV